MDTPPPMIVFALRKAWAFRKAKAMYVTKDRLNGIPSSVKRLAASIASCFVCACATATPFNVQGSIFEKAGKEFNVDPVLLYSIAVVESAVDAPNQRGYIQPSPWTLRTSKPYYAKSRQEAEEQLNRLLKTTRSIDVGMMQVNTRWHGHRVKEPKDLLDPLTNVRVAAQILSEQIARHPYDAALAIGNYHSSRPDRARWYARHVLRLYTNLKTQRR